MLLPDSKAMTDQSIAVERVRTLGKFAGVSFAKRVLDIFFVFLSLPMILPLLAIAAVAVKMSSPGPVLFAQNRYGLGRVPFRILKLRTMTVTEDGATFRQVTKGDPRITRVGAFLRKTSIDELPQVFNVLLGEMSLVGPRPHATKMDDEFSKKIDRYNLRFNVLPGITGLAQVRGHRGETDTLDKMAARIESDVEYVQTQSLMLDLYVIFQTFLVVLRQKNAF